MGRVRLVSCGLALACAACGGGGGLKQWVQGRQYEYRPDYSTENYLGQVVRREGERTRFRRNPVFAAHGERAELPDWKQKTNRKVTLGASASTTELLKKLGIRGKYERVHNVELELDDPYQLRARYFVPTRGTRALNHEVVTSVLNTGDMRLKIKDKSGLDIAADFEISAATSGGLEVKLGRDDEIVATGSGFFVGHQASVRSLRVIGTTRIRLAKMDDQCLPDVEICLSHMAARERNGRRECAVLIHPLTIPTDLDVVEPARYETGTIAGDAEFRIESTDASDVVKLLRSVDPDDVFDQAVDPGPAGTPVQARDSRIYLLRAGVSLGILASQVGAESVYLEVERVDADGTVSLRAQRLLYE